MKTKTYRVSVWTGPACVREVTARVNGYAGLLETRPEAGTEHVHWTMQASDQVDAYVRAQDLLAYVGLRSFSSRPGQRNGVQAREIS
jgi:hypothetical protein